MKKNLYSLLVLVFLLSGSSFAEVKFEDERRNLPTFERVALSLSCHVYIKQGSKQSVVLKGDRDDLEKIITEVSGGRLRIKTKSKSWGSWMNNLGDVDIYITMKDINGLSVSGSGRIETDGQIETEDLDLAMSGSGKIYINVDADEIDSSISGSGRLEIKGQSKRSNLSVSGSGRILAADLDVEDYDISISGSGRCEISVSGELKTSISGSGSVYYKGNPERVNNRSSGSGRVRKM